eukprot:TRINITY_DN3581_c0_g1_i2.p2 TRINITY_DN3581_c0_g1~~TRINITY_DN3581_c0_g1_i2.p2  ORF type:complete len:300 (-),score=47.95 TRINITY_DN3581_c0_g1_i2:111-1010(-)
MALGGSAVWILAATPFFGQISDILYFGGLVGAGYYMITRRSLDESTSNKSNNSSSQFWLGLKLGVSITLKTYILLLISLCLLYYNMQRMILDGRISTGTDELLHKFHNETPEEEINTKKIKLETLSNEMENQLFDLEEETKKSFTSESLIRWIDIQRTTRKLDEDIRRLDYTPYKPSFSELTTSNIIQLRRRFIQDWNKLQKLNAELRSIKELHSFFEKHDELQKQLKSAKYNLRTCEQYFIFHEVYHNRTLEDVSKHYDNTLIVDIGEIALYSSAILALSLPVGGITGHIFRRSLRGF